MKSNDVRIYHNTQNMNVIFYFSLIRYNFMFITTLIINYFASYFSDEHTDLLQTQKQAKHKLLAQERHN